ncbi:venom serine protease-like [Achroia grisella]|uniref:venom serine protease-like n=1 Tax=Achroia grisella TaxID=688607 RepID=UPI0027D21F94|nr:venom serine protease-like [Achroia grisella]
MCNKFLLFLLLVFVYSNAQDPGCDFIQDVKPNENYYIYSREYPNNYPPGIQCRWIGKCQDGYKCVLNCPEIDLPASSSCSMDRLLVSKSGDPTLTGADHYCGRGFLTAESINQTISVGLITSRDSPGGKFLCELTTKEISSGETGSCRCGYKKQTRIVGGEETDINEFPMMAALVDRYTTDITCGAVIIDKRYLLTAAHCVEKYRPTDFAVVVGEHNVDIGDSPATKGYIVLDVLIHPQYDPSSYVNDIAIVAVKEDIKFGPLVGPVCLPFKFTNYDLTGDTLTVLGWGTLFIGGPTSRALRKADLTVISESQCRQKVPSVSKDQICTYTPGKDSCQLDSGGPLLYTDSSTGLLFDIGVVSQGRSCASKGEPAVNTRVTNYLSWIVDSTPGAQYCRK